MILMARSYTSVCNFGQAEGERRGREGVSGMGSGRSIRKGRNCGEVPRGRAINADCAELYRDEGRGPRAFADKMVPAKKRASWRKGPLIAEILGANWYEDRG